MEPLPNDTKKVFRKLGTCSRTFFFLLNRAFGHNAADEERAADPLAGGLGLSGQGCGALAAAIWMHTLAWSRENPDKSSYNIPEAKETLERFKAATNGKMRCDDICGQWDSASTMLRNTRNISGAVAVKR